MFLFGFHVLCCGWFTFSQTVVFSKSNWLHVSDDDPHLVEAGGVCSSSPGPFVLSL